MSDLALSCGVARHFLCGVTALLDSFAALLSAITLTFARFDVQRRRCATHGGGFRGRYASISPGTPG